MLCEFGLACGGLPLAVLHSTIGNGDLAVLLKDIVSRAMGKVAFKAVVKASHFVPFAQVTVEVELMYGSVVDSDGGATGEDGETECAEDDEQADDGQPVPTATGNGSELILVRSALWAALGCLFSLVYISTHHTFPFFHNYVHLMGLTFCFSPLWLDVGKGREKA